MRARRTPGRPHVLSSPSRQLPRSPSQFQLPLIVKHHHPQLDARPGHHGSIELRLAEHVTSDVRAKLGDPAGAHLGVETAKEDDFAGHLVLDVAPALVGFDRVSLARKSMRGERLTIVVDSVARAVRRCKDEHVLFHVEGSIVCDGQWGVGDRTCKRAPSKRGVSVEPCEGPIESLTRQWTPQVDNLDSTVLLEDVVACITRINALEVVGLYRRA